MQCTAVPSVTAVKEEINVQLYRKLGRFIAAQYLRRQDLNPLLSLEAHCIQSQI